MAGVNPSCQSSPLQMSAQPLPPKRRWSAIAEQIASDSTSFGVSRPLSANDAVMIGKGTMPRGHGSILEKQQGVYMHVKGDYVEQTAGTLSRDVTRLDGATTQEKGSQVVQRNGHVAPSQARSREYLDSQVDNTTFLRYPELWMTVGFDPLNLGPEGFFTLRTFYQLGGREVAEFQTLFSKIKDFYQQFRSYPISPGVLYIPTDQRQVNINTIWMIVNVNLDNLRYYNYHGRYQALSPNLQTTLKPVPHTAFKVDPNSSKKDTSCSKPETQECFSIAVPTPTAKSLGTQVNSQNHFLPPAQVNAMLSPYHQYQVLYQPKASDIQSGNVRDTYYRESMVQQHSQSNLAYPRPSPFPKVANLKRRQEICEDTRMRPAALVVDTSNVKRRKVDLPPKTSSDVEEKDVSQPQQGITHYLPWIGKPLPQQPWNAQFVQTNKDYNPKIVPPVSRVHDQGFFSQREWTSEGYRRSQVPPHQGELSVRNNDVPRIKQERPPEIPDQALDLSVGGTVDRPLNSHSGVALAMINAVVGGNAFGQQSVPIDYCNNTSEVYSLKNMVDKTLLQNSPSNNGNSLTPGNINIRHTTIPNGTSNRSLCDEPKQKREFVDPRAFQKPNAPVTLSYENSPLHMYPTLHSKIVLSSDSIQSAQISEQPSSSIENGHVANTNGHVTNDIAGRSDKQNAGHNSATGRNLKRLNDVPQNLLKDMDKPSNDATKCDQTVQKEPEKLHKMPVPDMKVISEGHSTLKHMLAGLVGYPLSLVANVGLGGEVRETDIKSTKRISKMGAKILCQFLAGGTDCYDEVSDIIRNEYDVGDDEILRSEGSDEDGEHHHKKLLRHLHRRSNHLERTLSPPKYIPVKSSDILGQLLSGFKCYDSELHKLSVVNPKLDSDRDSEGESTYSCGSECGGCESCRGHAKSDYAWESNYNLPRNIHTPDNDSSSSENRNRKTENGDCLKRHPLQSYRMPLPARKRHIFMLQNDSTDFPDRHEYSQPPAHVRAINIENKTLPVNEGSESVQERVPTQRQNAYLEISEVSREMNENKNKAFDNSEEQRPTAQTILYEAVMEDESIGSEASSKRCTNDSDSNGTSAGTLRDTPENCGSLDLSSSKKRKVSLAIDSIPNDLFVDSKSAPGVGADSSHGFDSDRNSSTLISSSSTDSLGTFSGSIGLTSPMSEWSMSDVVHFVTSIPGCERYGSVFQQHSINGADLPHLTENYLHTVMKLSQGAAIRIRLTMAAS